MAAYLGAMAALVLLYTGGVPQAVAAPDPNDLCTLMPSALPPALPGAPTTVPAQPGNACSKRIYPTDPAPAGGYSQGGAIVVSVFASADEARAYATAPGADSSDPARPETTYGEAGEEFGGGSTGAVPALVFSIGCYAVYTNAGYVVNPDSSTRTLPTDTMYQIAGQTDTILSAIPPPRCPNAVPSTTPVPPALTAGLACDTNSLQDAGQVLCTASVTDQAPDAQIVYDWSLDGQPQSGVTGAELSLDNVAVGSHQVSVVARDTQNNISALPQSVPFARDAAGGQAGNVAPLVAGSALAIAGALGTVILLRHRGRIKAASGPSQARPTVRPRPQPVPTWRPQDPPRVGVTVRVSPSVRTRGLYSYNDVHIWADGVDLMFAEYDITVSPPEWQLVRVDTPQPFRALSEPRQWEQIVVAENYVPSMRYSFADGHTSFLNPIPVARIQPAPPPHTQVVITAQWSDQSHALTVWAVLDVVLRNTRTRETRVVPNVTSPGVQVQAIGAGPRLELWADPGPRGLADGSTRIRVDPALFLFGQEAPYPGGLEILQIPYAADIPGGEPLRLDDYFALTQDPRGLDIAGHPVARPADAAKRRQGVTLRCLFHLRDDPAMQRLGASPQGGYPVTFNVRPTGYGFGQESTSGAFDWMAAQHYRACREHLPQVPPDQIQPAVIRLDPCRIIIDPNPSSLPRPSSCPETERLFTSHIVVSLENSATGELATGDRLGPDTTLTGAEWSLALHYAPDTAPGPGPFSVQPLSIDTSGRLLFADATGNPQPFYAYDHQKRCWDDDACLLDRQNSKVLLQLMVQGNSQADGQIQIGKQPEAAVFCWDHPVFVKNHAKDKKAVDWRDSDPPVGPRTIVHTTETKLLADIQNGYTLPPDTIVKIARDHCGTVRPDGRIEHFLQSIQGAGWSGMKDRQGKPYNRDQLLEMNQKAELKPVPIGDFQLPRVYVDTLADFLKRRAVMINYTGPARELTLYLP
ncbi:hypothetical protein [Arthrobacter sp. GAS37]|uniref:hypothetical protein n=1 Tax=Arthrobacter sp. GAS37 TaxID=3156261 RepID=UPI0038510BC8